MHSKKRYCIAIAMSISCLFVSTCLNIYYYLRNERNESYLNETMTRSIKSMSSSIVNAEVMLSFVVDNKTITREQTDELYFQYHEFSYSIRELEELYIKVRGEQRLFNSANEYHLEIYQFFEHLRVEMDKNIQTVRKLNDNEINYYNEMLNISKCCSNILQKYRNKRLFVKEDEWIKLLKTLSTVDGKETKNNNSLKV